MNKKGVIIHWILFGVIAALGLFLLISESLNLNRELHGQWQLTFLHDFVYAAELDLLELDQKARNLGQEMALDLAKKGGFIGNCYGLDKERRIWNQKDQFCSLNLNQLVLERLAREEINLEEVIFKGTTLIGIGKDKTIGQNKPYLQKYTYHYGFTVDLSYSFLEYGELELEAKRLVNLCKEEPNLKECLTSKKEKWNFCEKISSRKVAFCVESDFQMKGNPVKYEFVLDFAN